MEDFKFEYYFIYFFAALISLIIASQSDYFKKKISNRFQFNLLIVQSLIFIFLFGMRSIQTGSDTLSYLYQFENYDNSIISDYFIMKYIFMLINFFNLSFKSFLLIMSFLFVGTLTISIYKTSKIFSSNPLLIFFCFISLFYFQSLGINIIRQAVSLSFLTLSMTNYHLHKNNKIMWIVPCMLSVSFHYTTIVPILLYFLIIYFDKIKFMVYYLIYLGCIILSSLKFSILYLKDYFDLIKFDNRSEGYLNGEDDTYIIGFKMQFLAFNTILLLLFVFIKSNFIKSIFFEALLKYYILSSAFFFLTFQLPYSDRWGLMSWIVIPFLASPIFSISFNKKIQTITCLIFIYIFIFFENYK